MKGGTWVACGACICALAKHHKKKCWGLVPAGACCEGPPTHKRGTRQPPGGAHLGDPWAMVRLNQLHTSSPPGSNKAHRPLALDHPKLHGGVRGQAASGGLKWHGYRRFGGMCSPSVNSAPCEQHGSPLGGGGGATPGDHQDTPTPGHSCPCEARGVPHLGHLHCW